MKRRRLFVEWKVCEVRNKKVEYITFYATGIGWMTINKNRFPSNPNIGDTVIINRIEFTYNDTMYPKATWIITKE